MKITPLEIRQKHFEINFRGYNKDEVNAFLLTLSQEWERLVDETREARLKLEAAEKEVAKLREVETSLFKTLKTAEDTGSTLIEQSRQAADLLLRESQMKADALLMEAKTKAKDAIDEAELRSRQVIAEMEIRLKALAENYKKLENSRDDLLHELKRIAQDTLERVERMRTNHKDFDVDAHLSQAGRELKKVISSNQPVVTPKVISSNQPVVTPAEPLKPKAEPLRNEPERELVLAQTVFPETTVSKKITSFFDEIE